MILGSRVSTAERILKRNTQITGQYNIQSTRFHPRSFRQTPIKKTPPDLQLSSLDDRKRAADVSPPIELWNRKGPKELDPSRNASIGKHDYYSSCPLWIKHRVLATCCIQTHAQRPKLLPSLPRLCSSFQNEAGILCSCGASDIMLLRR